MIKSEGDLEVVVLFEAHSLLASIIGPDFYTIYGQAPEQDASFKDSVCFDHFLVLAHEFIAESSIKCDGHSTTLSLQSGLKRFCDRYPAEGEASGLTEALRNFDAWLDAVEVIKRWSGGANQEVKLSIPHKQMLALIANAAKHQLLRLTIQLDKLRRWCATAGYTFSAGQIIDVHEDLVDELRGAFQYYSTLLIELIGRVFVGLNRVVSVRFTKNPTNDVSRMDIPAGVTDDVFKNLYGDLLVFHNYDEERIVRFTPTTGWHRKRPYWE